MKDAAGNKYVLAIKTRAWSVSSLGHDSLLKNCSIELTPRGSECAPGVNPAAEKYYTPGSESDLPRNCPNMTELIGISGSLRAGSFNSALLRHAQSVMPEGAVLHIASIAEIPLYNGDVEKAKGLPLIVAELKEQISAADGLLLVTPEYNNSIPGVFKNALDWLTRPPVEVPRLFGGRPVALCGASPGPGGTRLAQLAWLPILRTLGLQPWFGKTLALGEAHKAFDTEGRPRDEKVREQIRNFITGFVRVLELIGAIEPKRHSAYPLLLRKRRQIREAASPHRLLDLPPGAGPREARKALRRLVSDLHPDRLGADSPEALHRICSEVIAALVAADSRIAGSR